MKIRTRLFIAVFFLIAFSFFALTKWILDDLTPRYLEAMEESMIDTATLLSAFLSRQVKDNSIRTDELRAAMADTLGRRFSARIYDVVKTRAELRVYVVNDTGAVVFDSDNGRDEGRNYSQWNDVHRTLRGQYGARTTRVNPDDPRTAILHVAAPIMAEDRIIGAVTVSKPASSAALFLLAARRKTVLAGVVAAAASVILGALISLWISRPIENLTRYAQAVRDGMRPAQPRLGRSELGTLGAAFEEMRDALEGKRYIENYIQTLTHEMKAPLSAIRGASELLEDEMTPEQRARFLVNIRTEADRIRNFVDRLLQLSALEARKEIHDEETFDVAALLPDVVEELAPALSAKRVNVVVEGTDRTAIRGERFLVRQALCNILQNAVEFSPADSRIVVSVHRSEATVDIRVHDEGTGIPEYALGRVFERFYSLRRPDTGRKSSGLGLTFVREVAVLHQGRIDIRNNPDRGATAILTLPIEPA